MLYIRRGEIVGGVEGEHLRMKEIAESSSQRNGKYSTTAYIAFKKQGEILLHMGLPLTQIHPQ